MEPKETTLKTFHEVFAYFGNPKIMYKPMRQYGRQVEFESVSESLKNAFNNVVSK